MQRELESTAHVIRAGTRTEDERGGNEESMNVGVAGFQSYSAEMPALTTILGGDTGGSGAGQGAAGLGSLQPGKRYPVEK